MGDRFWKKVIWCCLTITMVLQSCSVSYAEEGGRYLVKDKQQNDKRILTTVGQIPADLTEDYVFYIEGKNYMPEGSILKAFYGDDWEYSCVLEETVQNQEDVYYMVRFAVRRSDGGQQEGNEALQEKVYWSLGDTVTRTIQGQKYRFYCVDQDYPGTNATGQQLALFLCDSVIPSDFGSSYEYEKQEDGTYDYIFYPGPVANFGAEADYKYSDIREWLKRWETDLEDLPWVDIGVNYSYEGQTKDGGYSQLDREALKAAYIGSQQLSDKVFILSVDEALRYRNWLWRFGSAMKTEGASFLSAENPETQRDAFCEGYWLRTPWSVNLSGQDLPAVYVVDLEKGTIRPQELQSAGTIGVRPAFVMPQG